MDIMFNVCKDKFSCLPRGKLMFAKTKFLVYKHFRNFVFVKSDSNSKLRLQFVLLFIRWLMVVTCNTETWTFASLFFRNLVLWVLRFNSTQTGLFCPSLPFRLRKPELSPSQTMKYDILSSQTWNFVFVNMKIRLRKHEIWIFHLCKHGFWYISTRSFQIRQVQNKHVRDNDPSRPPYNWVE